MKNQQNAPETLVYRRPPDYSSNLRLRHLLYDFLRGVLGLLPVVYLIEKAQNTPLKSHIANALGGHTLDEMSSLAVV